MKKVLALFVTIAICNSLLGQSVGGSVGSNTTVCSGNNSGLLTLSGHTGNVVRWQSSTTAGAAWSNISNTIANLAYANLTTTTWYRAEVLLPPSPPNISAFSTPAVITVDAPSSGTVSSNVAVCSGSNGGSLSLSGTFTGVNSWDSSIDGGMNWDPIANITTTQIYSNLTASTMYRASVTNGTCPAAYAAISTITVNPLTTGGSVAGTTTVCAGSNNGTLILTGNTGNIIRWQSSDDGGASWSNITNTSAIYNFSNLSATMQYRAVVQSGNCLIENSLPVTITVSPPSAGGTISSEATVCSGTNNGTLILKGYTGNILRWEKSTDGGANWISLANTTDLLNYSNLTATTIYRAVVNSGGCTSSNSDQVTITVSAPSVGGTVSGADTVCNGTNSGILYLSGHTGSVVRWQSSDDGGLSWSNITNTTGASTCNYANITSITDFRAVVQNGTCPADNSSQATITALPVSDGGSLTPSTYSACSGLNNGNILLVGQSGNIIRWESSIDGGISWTLISNTSSSQAFSNLSATTMFRVVVQQGQCPSAYSTKSTISVSAPTVGGSIGGSDTVCSGTNAGTITLNGIAGDILNWEYSKNAGVTWSNISNTTSTHSFTNLTATTLYRAVIKSGSCPSANSTPALITVNPVTIGGSVLASTTICDSSTSGNLILSGFTGNILNWQASTDSGSTWKIIPNTTNSQVYSGILTETMYKALVQSPACSVESSSTATISLAIPAASSFTFSANGATVVFANTSTNNGPTNYWTFGDNTSSTTVNPAHTYITNGTYSVQLVVSDSCGSDTSIQTVIITGLGTNEFVYNNPNVTIYPNPFSDIATVELNFDPAASIFKMVDVYGKEERSINIDQGTKILKLNRAGLPSGIYFYHIQSYTERTATGKLVIQ